MNWCCDVRKWDITLSIVLHLIVTVCCNLLPPLCALYSQLTHSSTNLTAQLEWAWHSALLWDILLYNPVSGCTFSFPAVEYGDLAVTFLHTVCSLSFSFLQYAGYWHTSPSLRFNSLKVWQSLLLVFEKVMGDKSTTVRAVEDRV